ncbi:hypothetical protein NUU61_004971 [Penicillium alfredii]|uniref:Uncharacterized protein n=1 Tax=Penicillium alfredii TaxID=1506179 RepID=A0A9W9F8J0_9EURO|nr:uncharacterized protein NUU61_004971 [Penicillium alfredii]KAJ5095615.1 hypothetical protein NUU61_004971 [Penicillium alfredii]
MVLLVTTDGILAALEAVPASRRDELELPASLELHGPITHESLLRLSRHLQNNTEYTDTNLTPGSPTVLASLLRGTTVYVPPPPKKPEPSPEYLASKARLLALSEQAAYQRLLNPTYTPTPDHADPHTFSSTEGEIVSEETLTPSLVLNIFLSVIITGFSVYWALTTFATPGIIAETFAAWTGLQTEESRARASAGQQGQGASEAVRVLLSLFAALAVAIAEAFLYGAYLGKVEKARVKERKIQERKTVVGTVESEGQVELADQKEEIWGKGVNGGMRRRVREKWEKSITEDS